MTTKILIQPVGGRPLSVPLNVKSVSLYDDDDEDDCEGPRKRRRLTHLTPEERMMRRKLKNRVAAQTARDRKKQRMTELEDIVTALEAENKRLLKENNSLCQKTKCLVRENKDLKVKLGMTVQVKEEKTDIVEKDTENLPFESAALSAPLPKEQAGALYLWTTCWLPLLLQTYSQMGLLNSCNKLPASLLQGESLPSLLKQLHSRMPLLQRELMEKWWGPQQKSWTPSMN